MQPKIEHIRAVDIRDWGLVDDPTIEVDDLEDIEDLYEGVDEDGAAL